VRGKGGDDAPLGTCLARLRELDDDLKV